MAKRIGKTKPAKMQEAEDQRQLVPRATRRNPRADMIVMIFANNRRTIDELESKYDLSEQIMIELFEAFLAILYEPVDFAARVPDVFLGVSDDGKEFENESTLSF